MTQLTEENVNQAPQAEAAKEPEKIDTDALTRTAGRGGLWQLVGAGWQTVVQLGASAVLARVLDHKDFGIMGMAVLARGLVGRIGALGTGVGLIVRQSPSQDDMSTAFWTGASVQTFLFVLTFLLAPLAALFFNNPALTDVIRVLSVMFLFTAAGAISGTLLRKRMRFGTLKIIEGGEAVICSGTAIILAVVFSLEYWSLVLAMVLSTFVGMTARIICVGWFPRFRFSRDSFRFLIRYGANEFGTAMVSWFRNNLDYLVVGKLLGAATLGLYEFAYRIPYMILNRVSMPVSGVLFPTLSKVQQSDSRLAAGYLKAARYIGIVAFPALGGLAAVATQAVIVLWSDKWLPVVIPLQILCFSAAVRCVLIPAGTIFMCKDRPDIPFKFGLFSLFFTFGCVAAFGYVWDLVGVAVGVLVSVAPSFLRVWLALRMTHTPLRKLFIGLAPPAIGAAVSSLLAGGAVYGVELAGGGVLVSLVAGICAGVLGYLLTLYLVFRETVRDAGRTLRLVLGVKSSRPK